MNLEQLYKKTLHDFNNYVELLYLKYSLQQFEDTPVVFTETIEKYLTRCGFITNYVLGERIYTRNFTCIKILEKGEGIFIWTDIEGSTGTYMNKSLITGLPNIIKYYDR